MDPQAAGKFAARLQTVSHGECAGADPFTNLLADLDVKRFV
jgi:hypothetical protein